MLTVVPPFRVRKAFFFRSGPGTFRRTVVEDAVTYSVWIQLENTIHLGVVCFEGQGEEHPFAQELSLREVCLQIIFLMDGDRLRGLVDLSEGIGTQPTIPIHALGELGPVTEVSVGREQRKKLVVSDSVVSLKGQLNGCVQRFILTCTGLLSPPDSREIVWSTGGEEKEGYRSNKKLFKRL